MQDFELNNLINGALSGDEHAFEQIYRNTSQDVYRMVSLLLTNSSDIQDVMNEVYIELWKSLQNYDRNRSFRFWLHGIVMKKVSDWRRKLWMKLRILDRKRLYEVESIFTNQNDVLQNEARQELVNIVFKLSYKLRAIIILRYFQDYSLQEIADLLQIPIGTVKSRHHLALKKLRQEFEFNHRGEVECPNVY